MFFKKPKSKKVYILMAHPDSDTFCGALADAYTRGAEKVGHNVRRTNLGDITFDPILHKGYKEVQSLEPALIKVQEDIRWADHFVIIHPMWWASMPALLKGLFDRMWLPGFAYNFSENGLGWEKLLHGKSAEVIITMDSWPTVSRLLFGDSTNEISRAILKFSGFHTVKVRKIGPVQYMNKGKCKGCVKKVFKFGEKLR
jgi:NAD(P)H dehydrogenase (quinone)